ncbi:SCP2 sterol-binding domain-containing protein [Streptomyces sp. NPDC057702]|uniref:SCP2 sterol-binding domain-containing protein n=1 Tax=unclassified Streptomyces TaxID=2593676 RepID=UPI0036B8DD6E
MATRHECQRALERLADRLAEADGGVRRAAEVDRSLSCHLTDLDVTFAGRLSEGRLTDVRPLTGPPRAPAAIRLTTTSDDLLALVDGRLPLTRAWASGRLRVRAGPRDLLRLRALT